MAPPRPTPIPTAVPIPFPVASPVVPTRTGVGVVSGPPITARFHHQGSAGDVRQVFAEKFAELADQKTSGRLKIEVQPAGYLYRGPDEPRAVGQNAIQFSLLRLADLAAIDPVWQFADLPLLLTPRAATRINYSDIPADLWQRPSQANLTGLALVDLRDPVILYTKDRPIQRLEDLRGLRVRTYLAEPGVHGEWLALFGATAVPVSAAEVYPALQRGQIDAVLTTVTGGNELGLASMTRYANVLPIATVPMALATNRWWFAGLPTSVRRVIEEEVIPEAINHIDSYLIRTVQAEQEKAARNGVRFVAPPPEVVSTIVRRTEADLYPNYESILTPEIIRRVRALQ